MVDVWNKSTNREPGVGGVAVRPVTSRHMELSLYSHAIQGAENECLYMRSTGASFIYREL